MSAIARILSRLHRVFNRSPKRVPVVRLTAAGGASVAMKAATLSVSGITAGENVEATEIDVAGSSVADVAAQINSLFPSLTPTFTRTGPATHSDESGGIRQVGDGAPRFEYAALTHEPLGIVLEGAGGNAIRQSTPGPDTTRWTTNSVSLTPANPVISGSTPQKTAALGADNPSANRSQSIGTFTGGNITAYAVVEVIQSQRPSLSIYNSSRAQHVARVELNQETETITTSGVAFVAAHLKKLSNNGPNGGKVFLVGATGAGPTGDVCRVYIYNNYAIAEPSEIVIHHVQAEVGADNPSSPIITTTIGGETRGAETLSFPVSIFNEEAGSLEVTITPLHQTGAAQYIIDHNTNGADRLGLYLRPDGKVVASIGDQDAAVTSMGPVTYGNQYDIAMTWGGNTVKLYINGGLQGEEMFASYPLQAQTVSVGTKQDGTGRCPCVISQLRVSSAARSQDEVLAWVRRQLTLDGKSTYYQPFYRGALVNGVVEATIVAGDYSERSARAILDDASHSPDSDPYLYYPENPLWHELATYGWELDDQARRLKTAEDQLYFDKAEGKWLDLWGKSYFGVPRLRNETDEQYGQRVIYEILRANQNNKALEIIVRDAIGVDVTILDAWPVRADLEPHLQTRAAGHFLLEMGIPNEMPPEEAILLIEKVKGVVRRHKAVGTDFFESVLRKLERPDDVVTTSEILAVLIATAFSEALQPGPIYCGAAWRCGTPGLKCGTNDAMKEQVYIAKILAADSTTESAALYGG
jgi:hypothetical protein